RKVLNGRCSAAHRGHLRSTTFGERVQRRRRCIGAANVMRISRERIHELLRHPVVRNALFLYGVQFSSYVFPLLTLPYLSRVLNPDRFGLVAFAQSFVWYFVTLTEYGFNLTATRRVAVERDNPEAVTLTFNSTLAAK